MATRWKVQSGRRSRKLAALGATAGALLTGAQSGHATPIHTVSGQTLNNPGKLTLDLDNNGTSEGEFVLTDDGQNNLSLDFFAGKTTWVLAEDGVANPLELGRNIGPTDNYLLPAVQVPLAGLVRGHAPTGPFAGEGPDATVNGFMGIWWDIPGGSQHFGWAQINVNIGANPGNPILTLVDYAFEDVAERSITAGAVAPEPGTLGLLALGAAGIAAWRRRRDNP